MNRQHLGAAGFNAARPRIAAAAAAGAALRRAAGLVDLLALADRAAGAAGPRAGRDAVLARGRGRPAGATVAGVGPTVGRVDGVGVDRPGVEVEVLQVGKPVMA